MTQTALWLNLTLLITLIHALLLYTKVPGWEEDISHCRTFDELPANARNYIKTIEDMLHAEINFISVGAKRDEYLLKRRVAMRHLITPMDAFR